ncbi:MAG: hypothetical protein RMY36_017865 [Nostoc sp. SerVER01]|nr:hypothetical protein [Nostoc sp. SerVER01]MDZ8083324.1 hypothetical protein [Nostoc sp. DcaGUA01]
MNSLTPHHDPHYPTPVLSKAKTSPPLAKGRGWGWGKRIVGQEFELKLTPMTAVRPYTVLHPNENRYSYSPRPRVSTLPHSSRLCDRPSQWAS